MYNLFSRGLPMFIICSTWRIVVSFLSRLHHWNTLYMYYDNERAQNQSGPTHKRWLGLPSHHQLILLQEVSTGVYQKQIMFLQAVQLVGVTCIMCSSYLQECIQVDLQQALVWCKLWHSLSISPKVVLETECWMVVIKVTSLLNWRGVFSEDKTEFLQPGFC